VLSYCLWAFLIAGQFAALARVVSLAAREYRFFALVLVIDLIRAGVLVALRHDPTASGWFWVFSEPVALAALAGATWEIVRRVPSHHPLYHGMFRRTRLMHLAQLALLIALVSAFIEARAIVLDPDTTKWLPLTIAAKRLITSLLAVYLVLIARSVATSPVMFQPNLVRHSFLFAAYLLLISTVMMWQNVAAEGRGTEASNAVLTLGSGMLFVLWSQLLKKKGEDPAAVRFRHEISLGVTAEQRSPEQSGRGYAQTR
jgi:hypothetical protein